MAATGGRGRRRYGWARVRVNGMLDPVGEYWLLARRSLTDPTEITYHLCSALPRMSLAELAWAAGTRWSIEKTKRPPRAGPDPSRPIALSLPEVRHLLVLPIRAGSPEPRITPAGAADISTAPSSTTTGPRTSP